MMSVTIDPSQTRPAETRPAQNRTAIARRPVARIAGRLILVCLGGVGLAGFSMGAYSMMGQLARPQPVKVAIGRQAADWPDLKDGLPVMAPVAREASKPLPQSADAKPASEARGMPTTAAIPSPAPPKADAPRLPPIEVATVIDSGRLAPVVKPALTASLVAPTAAETVRARAAETRFVALPPAPAAAAARPVKKPSPASARAKPAPESAASPAAAPATAPPIEAEETEVFGMKVPSLASSGRKLVEGVQSLGDAVAKQF